MKHPLLALTIVGIASMASAQYLNVNTTSRTQLEPQVISQLSPLQELMEIKESSERGGSPFTFGLVGAASLLAIIATRRISKGVNL